MHFPDGMLTLAKVQAHEVPGMLLVMLVIIVMDDIHKPVKERGVMRNDTGYVAHKLGPDRLNTLVKGISLTLQFEAFAHWTAILKRCMEFVGAFIPDYVDQWKQSFPRPTGNGHNLLKVHLTEHYCMDCIRYGCGANWSGNCLEKGHQHTSKGTCSTTQRRNALMAQQTMKRNIENMIVDRAFHGLPTARAVEKRKHFLVAKEDAVDYKAEVMTVAADTVKESRKKKRPDLPEWKGPVTCMEVVTFIREYVLPHISQDSIRLVGETIRKGVRFKANPMYGAGNLAHQHWAVFDYESDGLIPGHLLCFMELTEDPTGVIDLHGSKITKKGMYVFAHLLPCALNGNNDDDDRMELANPNSRILYRCQKWDKDRHGDVPEWNEILGEAVQPTLQVLPCDSIAHPCVAFLDPYEAADSHIYFILKPHEMWAEDFATLEEEHVLAHEADLRKKVNLGQCPKSVLNDHQRKKRIHRIKPVHLPLHTEMDVLN